VIATIDRYSISTEERQTIDCFVVFQDIGDRPRSTNQHVR